MKTADSWQVRDQTTGLYLQTRSYPEKYVWIPDPLEAGAWGRPSAQDLVERPWRYCEALEAVQMELVLTPQCGCCGKSPRSRENWVSPWVIQLQRFVRRGLVHWRCDKHVGRNPCCIEGCGSTFALKPDEDYFWRFICGRHWREAPRRHRDRVAKMRRLAKRRGWTDQIHRIHSMAWDLAVQAVIDRRRIAVGEIALEPSAGPPPTSLLNELARIGL